MEELWNGGGESDGGGLFGVGETGGIFGEGDWSDLNISSNDAIFFQMLFEKLFSFWIHFKKFC